MMTSGSTDDFESGAGGVQMGQTTTLKEGAKNSMLAVKKYFI